MGSDSFVLLLEKAKLGDRSASNAVYRMAFQRLKGIASALLRRERPGHSLQPTALVTELFLKMQRLELQVLGEEHFFRLAARAMSQVLIDHARVKKNRQKVALEMIPELLTRTGDGSEVDSQLAVRDVFDRLGAIDALAAGTIWLRYVEGFTIEQIAREQRREAWRIRADCDFGLQWMANQLSQ